MADANGYRTVDVVLPDGRRLKIRPIRPDDRKRLEAFFYRLSPRARYLRFGHVKDTITEEELTHFTEVTPPERGAYVATAREGAMEEIIAVGRWDMLPDRAGAEVAFAVDDNVKLSGIGAALLEELAGAAVSFKITRLTALVLPENSRMIEVFEESGFKYRKTLREGTYEFTIDLKEQEEYSRRQAMREHVGRSAGVRRLLAPRRVAVIGASRSAGSVGGALFRNILKDGFQGAAFPVNPSAESVAGVFAYPKVTDVPGDVDVAVIVVPAKGVLEVIDQCGKKGVTGLVIISAGFAESGGLEGKERERLLTEKALYYGMRIIGPNCLGVLNNNPAVSFNATFSPVTPPFGNISIGTQSGALGLALLDHAKGINLGISCFVSFGNCADISGNDLLEYWEDDDNTQVITLYMESFGSPRKFGRTARRVTRKKPIIAVKAGRSSVGAAAATSHTGALAASDVAADALFRQAGVIRVTTIQEMFNAAEFLSRQPLTGGPNVCILTNAGGPGVLAADACEALP